MSLRTVLVTMAFVLAGALAFIFAALGTVVLLADRESGASGGATPATASHEGDQVALGERPAARGEGSERGAPPIKARTYFLDEILRR